MYAAGVPLAFIVLGNNMVAQNMKNMFSQESDLKREITAIIKERKAISEEK